MDRAQAAAALNGCEYTREGSKVLFSDMKAAGLVAVFGGSDDLMELRGAIYDEIDCYGGGSAFVTPHGLFEPCSDECVHSERAKQAASEIKAIWDRDGFSWIYETAIPHETFIVKEDDDTYCRGIVFALADVPSSRPHPTALAKREG
jgi:hypothetical protein